MSDAQEYFDWKEDIDDALCMLHKRIFVLEEKVRRLEKNAARSSNHRESVSNKKIITADKMS